MLCSLIVLSANDYVFLSFVVFNNIFKLSNTYVFLQILIILGFLIIIYKSHKFIIDIDSKDTSFEDVSWEYKKKFGNLFWFLLIIQIYFLWTVFFFPLLFYVNTEVLIDLQIFKIIKIRGKD